MNASDEITPEILEKIKLEKQKQGIHSAKSKGVYKNTALFMSFALIPILLTKRKIKIVFWS